MARARARHILVDTEDTCLDLKTRIEGGEDFADLAKAHSKCPSGQSGGDLGEFGRGQMVPEFDEAVFSGEVGKVLGHYNGRILLGIIYLGVVTVGGLADDVVMRPVELGTTYFDTQLTHPTFVEGDLIELRTHEGGAFGDLEMHGIGVAPLVLTNLDWTLADGADFVVLDRDLTSIDVDDIAATQVLRTVVGGVTVYDAASD